MYLIFYYSVVFGAIKICPEAAPALPSQGKTRDCASARIDNMSYLPVSESVISPQPPLYFFAVTKIVQIERIKKQLVDFFVPKCSLSY